jgi:hypothetical protein
MLKTKSSALLSLLLVFMSGVLVGGFAYRLYNDSVAAAPNSGRRPDPEEVRKHMVADMQGRLKLDDRQLSQLQQILDRTRAEFDQLHDRMNAEGRTIHGSQLAQIKAMLRDDQVALYEQWRAERERERDRREHKKGEKK